MKRKIAAVLMAVTLGLTLAACEQEGPAEKAGASIDNAVDKAGDQIEKAGDAVKEKTDN